MPGRADHAWPLYHCQVDGLPRLSRGRQSTRSRSRTGRPLGDQPGDLRGRGPGAVSPISARISARLAWSRKRCGMPKSRTGTSTSASRSRPGDRVADAADPAVVLDDDDQRCARGGRRQRLVERLDPARVDDGGGDALRVEQVGGLQAHRGQRADGDQQHVGRRRSPARSTSMPPSRPTASIGAADRRPWGSGRTVGPSSTSTASRSSSRSRVAVARGGDPQAGDDLEDRHVPHAVVAGAVVAGDAGPVEHEGDRQPVQGDVHQELVEGAVEEGGVDGDDRVQPAERQARRRWSAACCSAMPTS